MLLLLLNLQRELAPELLDLLGAGERLVLVLDAPVVGVGPGLDQLALEVETRLGLLLQLTPDRLQLRLDRVQLRLERRATLRGARPKSKSKNRGRKSMMGLLIAISGNSNVSFDAVNCCLQK